MSLDWRTKGGRIVVAVRATNVPIDPSAGDKEAGPAHPLQRGSLCITLGKIYVMTLADRVFVFLWEEIDRAGCGSSASSCS